MTFTEAKLDGDWICFKVNEIWEARKFILRKQNRLYDLEIKQHREKRSNDANAYYWELCGKIAKKVNCPPVEIYRQHIQDIGNYEVICLQDKAVDTFCRCWTSGHLGRAAETRQSKIKGCTTVLAYYGSSDFDKADMSRLIDNCIQDCKALGIETMPPDKMAALLGEWDAQTDKSNGNP